MNRKDLLLPRLDAIGRSLERAGHALALLGLGSVGVELERLDDDSDLDFFAIVEEGFKARFVEDLDWLAGACPIAYRYRNTADGHKVLFADGVFCEFAVFEPAELRSIPFARGRIVWKQPQVDPAIGIPARAGEPTPSRAVDWLLGEVLTNLYVGLSRFHRGEKLSALRSVQFHAVERALELAERVEPESPADRDPFSNERRYERRYPGMAQDLPQFLQGYERTPQSALALLSFLERRFDVNPAMAAAIRERC